METLHVGGYVMEVWDGSIDCIPQFLYLVELHTLMFPTSAAMLLESIRENGSWLSIALWEVLSRVPQL
jgi:hypothetical protein